MSLMSDATSMGRFHFSSEYELVLVKKNSCVLLSSDLDTCITHHTTSNITLSEVMSSMITIYGTFSTGS